MIRKAIISGGGTGGHIFPAISIAEALRRRYPDIDILFIGAEGRMEMQRVPQAGFPIQGLKIRGVTSSVLWSLLEILFAPSSQRWSSVSGAMLVPLR